MKVGSKFVSTAVALLCASVSLSAQAATVGACTSTNTGSTGISGAGIVPTSPLHNLPAVQTASGSCSASGVDLVTGASALGMGTSLTTANSSGSSSTAGAAISLVGSGSVSELASLTNMGGAPTVTPTHATSSLSQAFSLAPGQSEEYSFSVTLSGSTDSNFRPTFDVSLTGGASSVFNFAPVSIPTGQNFAAITRDFSGTIKNTSSAPIQYSLVALAGFGPYSLTAASAGSSLFVDDNLTYQYHLDVTPVPLPASVWLLLCSLVAGTVVRRHRHSGVTA